jgi:hypothetical protein
MGQESTLYFGQVSAIGCVSSDRILLSGNCPGSTVGQVSARYYELVIALYCGARVLPPLWGKCEHYTVVQESALYIAARDRAQRWGKSMRSFIG